MHSLPHYSCRWKSESESPPVVPNMCVLFLKPLWVPVENFVCLCTEGVWKAVCFIPACSLKMRNYISCCLSFASYASQVYNLYVASSHCLSSWIGVYELDLCLCITTRLSILLRLSSLREGYGINSKIKCKRVAWERALFGTIIINLNWGNIN